MQDNDDPIGTAARRLFGDIFDGQTAEAPGSGTSVHYGADRVDARWNPCVEGGFVHALLAEEQGGIGLTLPEYFSTALAAGASASPLPIVHTALFLRMLASDATFDAPVPEGAITYAERAVVNDGVLRAIDVPWAGVSQWAVAETQHGVWLLPVGSNSGDGRELVCQGGDPQGWKAAGGRALSVSTETARAVAAAGYSALLAGVLERMLDLTVQYAGERQQFGKPIGRFQAIQQQISAMAERVKAARMAAQIGFTENLFDGNLGSLAVGKAITSEVVPLAASVAHAVHGAIGITAEYVLQRYTGAAHVWRGAAGGEVYWRRWIGQRVLADQALPRDFLRTRLSGTHAAG